MDRLQKQSFGLIMLLLAIVAIAPGISIVGGLLLLIPAFQMIAGRAAPVFPRWIADRPLPTKHLGAVVQRAISVLKYLEKVVRPRCPTPPDLTKRVVGIFVRVTERKAFVNADSTQQHPSRHSDRVDLARVS